MKVEATCPHCCNIFSDPQILPCGHNVCLSCTVKLKKVEQISQDKKNDNNNSENEQELANKESEKVEEKTICPVCQTASFVRDLKPNNALNKIAEILKDNNSGSSVLCDRCNKRVATLECQDCMKSELTKYCVECSEITHQGKVSVHKRGPLNSLHQVVKSRCNLHNKNHTLWCQKDVSLVCMHCMYAGHKGHNSITLDSAAKEVETKLDGYSAKVSKRKRIVQSVIRELRELVEEEVEVQKAASEKVVSLCNEIRQQVDNTEKELLKLIADTNYSRHKSERKSLLNELTKLEQFELSAKGAKLMSQPELVKCNLDIPKFESFPKIVKTKFTFPDCKDVIRSIGGLKVQEESIPHVYFGDDTDGDLVVEEEVEFKGSIGNYTSITVKKGGSLVLPPAQTILHVSNVFSIEEGGTVIFPGSIIIVHAAKEINLCGQLMANGLASQPGSNGGNIIMTAKKAHITGSVTALAGPTPIVSTPNSYQNQILSSIFGSQYEQPDSVFGRPGTISLQYKDGEIKDAKFSPSLSPARKCFDLDYVVGLLK